MDKKFGKKRVCENCSVKFMDFNKPSPLKCPHCNHENSFDEIINNFILNHAINSKKQESKNLFEEKENKDSEIKDDNIDNINEVDDDNIVVSLDEVDENETQD